jgi:26S proteasome regulatory subunit N7
MSKKKDADGTEAAQDYDPYREVKAKGERFKMCAVVFRYSLDRENHDLREDILRRIDEGNMGPFYEHVVGRFDWPLDQALVQKYAEANAASHAKLVAALEDAKANAGDGEQLDAAMNIAEHFANIGDKAKTLEALDAAHAKAFSAGQKIDITLAKARTAIFFGDQAVLKDSLDKTAKLIEEGGDWDRRNRLQVYQGTQAVLNRDFASASSLFLASLPTFTAFELHTYDDFVALTVVVSVLALERPDLKAKVIDSPEILSVVDHIPFVAQFVNALYDCKYKAFMEAIIHLHDGFQANQYLSAHVDYVLRECRVLAYRQFLQSYKSVTLSSMAGAFGFSEDFLDLELSRFIAVKRLSARIDKVGGIVETCRPDTKNAQYQAVIKDGDHLLNRIQKLSRVISV